MREVGGEEVSIEGEGVDPGAHAATADPAEGDPATDTAGGAVPVWLGTLAAMSWRALAVVAFALVVLYVAILLSTVTASVLVAFLVAAFFAPIDQRLRARGWAPTKAASATSVAALIGALAVAILVAVGFAPAVAELIRYSREGVDSLAAELARVGMSPTAVDFVVGFLKGFEQWITAVIGSAVDSLGELTTVLILGGFLTFFLLLDGDRAWGDIARSLAGSHYTDLTAQAWLAAERVGSYLRTTFVLAGIDAVSDLAFLLLLGVPLAGPLAALAFIAGFIPYLGAVFALVVLALAAWATQGTTAMVVLVTLIVVVNLVETLVVAPRLYGKVPRISPALVIIALPAGATLFGILGLIVAVPLVVAVVAVLPSVGRMLEDDPHADRQAMLVPVWLDRLAQWSVRAVVVIVALGVVIGATLLVPIVTVPAILACVLAATLRPLMSALRTRGLGLTSAAVVSTAGSAVFVFAVVGFTLASIVGSAADIAARAAEGAANTGLGSAPVELVDRITSGMSFNAGQVVQNVTGIGLALLIVLTLTYFLLQSGPAWWEHALRHVPADRREPLRSVVSNTADILSGYMVGTGSIAVFAGITQWLMMALLGLPLALPIGVLTFFLTFIPYIGDLIATVLGFLVAVAVGDTTTIILMGVFTVVINIVQGNIIAPLVYRRTVSLHPAIVLMAAPAGAALGGMIGMFLIVPFLGIIAASWRTVLRLFDPEGMRPADGAPATLEPGTQSAPDAPPPAHAAQSVSPTSDP
jgi:putative heme transporter